MTASAARNVARSRRWSFGPLFQRASSAARLRSSSSTSFTIGPLLRRSVRKSARARQPRQERRRPIWGRSRLEETAEPRIAARAAQLRERLRLDLADPLARHAEFLADLFERARRLGPDPEPELQDR